MKTILANTPCWVLSSHGHPYAARGGCQHFSPEVPAQVTRHARPLPRRRYRRPAAAVAYWLEADVPTGSNSR